MNDLNSPSTKIDDSFKLSNQKPKTELKDFAKNYKQTKLSVRRNAFMKHVLRKIEAGEDWRDFDSNSKIKLLDGIREALDEEDVRRLDSAAAQFGISSAFAAAMALGSGIFSSLVSKSVFKAGNKVRVPVGVGTAAFIGLIHGKLLTEETNNLNNEILEKYSQYLHPEVLRETLDPNELQNSNSEIKEKQKI